MSLRDEAYFGVRDLLLSAWESLEGNGAPFCAIAAYQAAPKPEGKWVAIHIGNFEAAGRAYVEYKETDTGELNKNLWDDYIVNCRIIDADGGGTLLALLPLIKNEDFSVSTKNFAFNFLNFGAVENVPVEKKEQYSFEAILDCKILLKNKTGIRVNAVGEIVMESSANEGKIDEICDIVLPLQ